MTKPEGAFPTGGGIWQEISDLTPLQQCSAGREEGKGQNCSSLSKRQNWELSHPKPSRKGDLGGAVPEEAKPRLTVDTEPGPPQEQGPGASVRGPGCCQGTTTRELGTGNNWPAQKENFPSLLAGEGLALPERCFACGLG